MPFYQQALRTTHESVSRVERMGGGGDIREYAGLDKKYKQPMLGGAVRSTSAWFGTHLMRSVPL